MKNPLSFFSSGSSEPTPQDGKLGTFGGVFTPSILTILGVIMYLRFGWVVGNAGLIGTLAIVTLATSITFLTTLSISAIATDQRVKIGGAYYMISRSLGIETGGAVGIPLYFAQALSVALYTIGFAESLAGVFPVDQRTVGLITTLAVAALALISAQIVIRSQYIIMAAIAVSLLSLLFGSPVEQSNIEMFGASDRVSEPFWTVFAVFFPAVTGIMAGVNLSGDLRNPTKSIPLGTFAAVGVGYVIYMLLPILLATRADAVTLIEDPLIMREMAFWGDAILLGVWGATLSSALGSILGAPRVLQALARDGVLPPVLRWLGRGSGESDQPRVGTFVTLGVALTAVYFGNLNLIAPILSMFFLTTYAVLNIAAALEQLLSSPSFRPEFRVHWGWSVLGAVGCIAVMLLINALATAIAVVVVLVIFAWLERRGLRTAWGDVRQGLWMEVTRAGLLRLSGAPDPKNWRPHLLVLSGAPTKRWHLVDLAMGLSHNRALVTIASVLTDRSVSPQREDSLERTVQDYLEERGVHALLRVVRAPDSFAGAERLVEMYGLGPLVPNTVLLGDSESAERRERFCQMLANFHQSERNLIIVHNNSLKGYGHRKRIDVWWGGLKGNGGLMMTLAYLLATSPSWRGAEIRIKMVVDSEKGVEGAKRNLDAVVGSVRTGAKTDVILSGGRSFNNILRESSANADLVFLGMRAPEGDDYVPYYESLQERADRLPTTVFVLAAENLEFEEILTPS